MSTTEGQPETTRTTSRTKLAALGCVGLLGACVFLAVLGAILDVDDEDDDSLAIAEAVTPTATVAVEATPTPEPEPEPTATPEPELHVVRIESEAGTVRNRHGETAPDAYAPIDLLWAEVWLDDDDFIIVRFAVEGDIAWIDDADDTSTYTVVLASDDRIHSLDLWLRKYEESFSHSHSIEDHGGHHVPGTDHRHNWQSEIDGNQVTLTIDRKNLGDVPFPEKFTWAIRTSVRPELTPYVDMLPQVRELDVSRSMSIDPINHAEYP